jgi:hypothetical protein
VPLPDAVSSEAAAAMLKGFTACYLGAWAMGPGTLPPPAASILEPWLRDKGVVVVAQSLESRRTTGSTVLLP